MGRSEWMLYAVLFAIGLSSQTWWFPQYIGWLTYIGYLALGTVAGVLSFVLFEAILKKTLRLSLFERKWLLLLVYSFTCGSIAGLGRAFLVL